MRFHEGPRGHSIHDVQVTPEGNLLFFNNHVDDGSKKLFSAIQEMNPLTKKVSSLFTARPKEMFYTEGGGGVQRIGDNIFFSHTLTGGYLYSTETKDIVKLFPQNREVQSRWIQEIKMIDASGFLKNSN